MVSGLFAPRYFRSSERKFPLRTFAPGSESSQHMTVKPITLNKQITISTIECVLHAKLRNRTCQGLDRQGQGPSLQGPGQGQRLDLQGQ